MHNRSDAFIAAGLALATTIVVWTMAPFGFNSGFVDMAHDGYQLRQALDLWHGGTLFKDTFDQYGLLSPQLNQIGFAFFGQRLLGIKEFLAIWYGATAVLLYFLSRRFLDRALGAATVGLWLLLAPFYQHGVMISPHAYAVGFQAAALILMLRDEEAPARPSRLWMIGVLAGITALLKQSLGVLFIGSLVLYVAGTVLTGDETITAALKRILRLAGGFAIVLAAGFGWLLWHGAIQDWYQQTVAFPQSFYVASTAADNPGIALAFVDAQRTAEPVWLILRFIIIGGGIAAVAAGRQQRKLLLVALVMLALWLAAFPSANYMHQWWTIGPALCGAVYSLHWLSASLLARSSWRSPAAASWLTIALVAIIGWWPITGRLNDAGSRFSSLSQAIVEPAVLAGIHSEPGTVDVLAAMNSSIAGYRAEHPGTPLISIDASDGYKNGIAQSLITLSFIQESQHPHPVYWNLPVLSTTAYPDYAAEMSRFISDKHPLIVDFRAGKRPIRSVRGYRLRRSGRLGGGRLFLYEPMPSAESVEAGTPVLQPSPNGRELVVAPNRLQLSPDLSGAPPAALVLSPEVVSRLELLVHNFGMDDVKEPGRRFDPNDKYSPIMTRVLASNAYGIDWQQFHEPERLAVQEWRAWRIRTDFHSLIQVADLDNVVSQMASVVNLFTVTTINGHLPIPATMRPLLGLFISAGKLLSPEGVSIVDMEELDDLVAESPAARMRTVKDESDGALHRVAVQTWPSALDVPESLPLVVPDPGSLIAMKDRILTGEGGAWVADGPVGGPQSYLLQYRPKARERGAVFVVVGELRRGGLSIGLLREDRWIGHVNVTTPGWFAAVVQVPEAGDYAAVLANNLPAMDQGVLGRLTPAWLQNSVNQFRIASVGWTVFDGPDAPKPAK